MRKSYANNIIEDNYAYGVHIYPSASNVIVQQNTIIGNGRSGVIIAGKTTGCDGPCPPQPTNNLVVNNIIAYNKRNAVLSYELTGSGNVIRNNIFWGNEWGDVSNEIEGLTLINNIQADPRFVGAFDYHLLSGSPAIDAANSSYTQADDYDGTLRPQGAAPDIGVFEYNDVRINNVTPKAGRAAGGQSITLSGAFAGLSTVTIGGTAVSWSYISGTSAITFTLPAHAVGAVDIVLTPTSGSTHTKSNAFAYLPTVFTDNALVVGVTTAKVQHITELRQAVDALRAVAGQGPAPWTDPMLLPFVNSIKATHITELRTYLNSAAALLGYSTVSYTDPSLSAGFQIKRVHIEELRQHIRAIAG